ncbi:NADPH dehydrogenase NamA [Parasediminibacterium sp. JCM 36343]|uniref:NADPH dehydrogenase NamA n=1 Tax=Parasediminibacterium sp. JCM 36343 TaxID=3374279 RepID=UPI00397C78B5
MSQLFTPLHIKGIVLKNRIAISPMCQYSSVDGFASDWHLVHIGSRAVGGAGLIIMEASAVVPEGRITPSDLGIWKDGHIENLLRITQFVKAQGSVPAIQLAHAGRKASVSSPWAGNVLLSENEGGWQPVAPSALAFNGHYAPPKALTIAEIKGLVTKFKEAASRALAAGFEIVEIHAAHGYLIHEFLSPLSNTRTDEYGGSFENRVRFLLEITDAIKAVWPASLPLFVRISATDWVEGGWSIEDSVSVSALLKEKGIDLIDCSSGGNISHAKIPVGPLYQVPFAAQIKQEAGILTGAVGLITDAPQAEAIIATGQADLVLMARELLRNPYFPFEAAQELGYEEMAWPVQYERAKK